MPTHNRYTDVYYKILIPLPRTKNLMRICEVQDFDEYDYNTDEWLTDDEDVVSFDSKEDAQRYLADNVDPKWIDPADLPDKAHISHWRPKHD